MPRHRRTVLSNNARRAIFLTAMVALPLAMIMLSSGFAYSSQIPLIGILSTGTISTSPSTIPRYNVYIEGVILSDNPNYDCKRGPSIDSSEGRNTNSIEGVCLKFRIGDLSYSGKHKIYTVVTSDEKWTTFTSFTASISNRGFRWVGGPLNGPITQGEVVEISVALEKEG